MQALAPLRLYRTVRSHGHDGHLTVATTVRCRPPLPPGQRLVAVDECRLLSGPITATDESTVISLALIFLYCRCGRFGPAVHHQCRLPVDLVVEAPAARRPARMRLAPGTRLRGAGLSPDRRELCASLLILATWQAE